MLYPVKVQFWSVSSSTSVLSYALSLPADSQYYPHTEALEAFSHAVWRMLSVARTPSLAGGAAVVILQITLLKAKVCNS